MHFFEKKMPKNLVISKKSSTFAPAFEKQGTCTEQKEQCSKHINVHPNPDEKVHFRNRRAEAQVAHRLSIAVSTIAILLPNAKGAVVQLVRIPACHAVGREFESRPHRKG